jgi:hypothetical protein
MATGPDGKTVSFDARIEDIYDRYGPDHDVSRALNSSRPCLAACYGRTAARLLEHAVLADVWLIPPLKVMLDAKPY